MIQVAYGASSTILNDREEYPFFARVIPPDNEQAKAMVNLLRKLNDEGSDINTVHLLYSSSLYGRTAAIVS